MDIAALDPTRTTSATGTAEARTQSSTDTKSADRTGTSTKASQSSDSVELSQEAQAEVTKLKARDTEVKAHEAAHLAAAGGLAESGANYSYTRGPDGKDYATGGEVTIDTGVPKDPNAALAKARQIYAAALAPADPSAQDRQVAAQALQMEATAYTQLAKQNQGQSTASKTASTAYQAASSSSQSNPGLDVVA